MATFPSITPTYAGFSKRSNPNKRVIRFMDGYEHRILFGLASHQNPKIYSLIFEVTEPTSCLSDPEIFRVVCFSTTILIPSGISKFIS